MNIRLVAMDLDGTLLNSEKKISQENAAALRACEARGIRMVMASGRGFESISAYAREIGLKSPIISANGARIDTDPDGVIMLEYPFDPQTAETVYAYLMESGLFFTIYAAGKLYRCNGEAILEERRINPKAGWGWHEKKELSPVTVIDDPAMTGTEGLRRVHKFVVFSYQTDRLDALRRKLAEALPLGLSSSWFDNLEVLRDGAGKGRAVQDLAAAFGLETSQVMAFGDNLNDIGMLESAGVSVAMGNAVDPVKQIAKVVAPTNDESGVGRILQRLVLA